MCRSGRSGSQALCVKQCACPLASSHHSIAVEWTSSPRAAPSTSAAHSATSHTRPKSACTTASPARWSGSAHMAGSEIPKAQEELFACGTSSRAKYVALVVGQPGLGALLKYEFVVMFTQSWPGAIGLALRKTLYPWLLGS